MQEWKIRQDVFHRLNTEHDDDLKTKEVTFTNEIVRDAVRYFTDRNIGWVYPSKSYMVGICYAKWLADVWGGDPYDYLDDPELLHKNDPYFVPYEDDKETYDAILSQINGWQFVMETGLVPDVHKYFIAEFMLEENPVDK